MTDLLTITNAEHAFVEHEHLELVPGIEHIRKLSRHVGTIPVAQLEYELLLIIGWFETTLSPHIAWEDHVVYDRVDERAETTWATKLMRFEHDQIRRLANLQTADRRLLLQGPVTHAELLDVRGHLSAVEALIRAHIEREEAFLFPLLVQ